MSIRFLGWTAWVLLGVCSSAGADEFIPKYGPLGQPHAIQDAAHVRVTGGRLGRASEKSCQLINVDKIVPKKRMIYTRWAGHSRRLPGS